MKKKVGDITTQILISIRDEIVGLRGEIVKLREDTNARFEQMDRRFEHMEQDMAAMKQDIKAIAAHFDRDYLVLASDVGNLKGRVTVCEKALNIAS